MKSNVFTFEPVLIGFFMVVFCMIKSRAKGAGVPIRWHGDGKVYTFAPSADIPEEFAKKLLPKMMTHGGCCGIQERTSHAFATAAQVESGERGWIE